jgi:hypothetical protein
VGRTQNRPRRFGSVYTERALKEAMIHANENIKARDNSELRKLGKAL